MGRARKGRVQASPPFCESITRSRWVGSCYSGASTPSLAGLFCVQWTGESCLSTLSAPLLALQPSSCGRLGLLGATGSPTGATAPPGSFLSPSRGRGGKLPGARGVPYLPSRRSADPALPTVVLVSGLSAASPNTRGGRATLSAGLPRATLCASHVPLPAIRAALPATRAALPAPRPVLPAPRPTPTRACAVTRTPLRPRCACAAFPAAPTLHSAFPARGGLGRAGKTPPFCPEGRGPSSAPALPLLGLPTKNRRAPSSAPGPGVSGRGPRAPFVPAIPQLLVLESFKHELAHFGRGVTGPGVRGSPHVGRHDRTPSFRAVQPAGRATAIQPPREREGSSAGLVCVPGARAVGRAAGRSRSYIVGYPNLKQVWGCQGYLHLTVEIEGQRAQSCILSVRDRSLPRFKDFFSSSRKLLIGGKW